MTNAGQMSWNEHQSQSLLTRGGNRSSSIALLIAAHSARSWRSMASSWVSTTGISYTVGPLR